MQHARQPQPLEDSSTAQLVQVERASPRNGLSRMTGSARLFAKLESFFHAPFLGLLADGSDESSMTYLHTMTPGNLSSQMVREVYQRSKSRSPRVFVGSWDP